MVKGNYGQSYQQSLNEIFATRLHEQQGFQNFTSYSLAQVQVDENMEGLGCMSYDFCSENIECISAWELLQTVEYSSTAFHFFLFYILPHLGYTILENARGDRHGDQLETAGIRRP